MAIGGPKARDFSADDHSCTIRTGYLPPRPPIIETQGIAGVHKSFKGSPALPAVRHLTFVPFDN